jgi:hypothetical protein
MKRKPEWVEWFQKQERLPSKREALSSNSNAAKTTKKSKEKHNI